jgi:hypothetical protein
MFTNKGYANWNALIWSEAWLQYSSTNGRVMAVLFRVKNKTNQDLNWRPYWWWTSWQGWSETAGVALNGNTLWTGDCGGGNCASNINITIPRNRTSTVIFTATISSAWSFCCGVHTRRAYMAFYNNSLRLPDGLEFVDDLHTASGGWDQ